MTIEKRLTLAQLRSIQDDVRLLQREWWSGFRYGVFCAVCVLLVLAFATLWALPYLTHSPITIRL